MGPNIGCSPDFLPRAIGKTRTSGRGTVCGSRFAQTNAMKYEVVRELRVRESRSAVLITPDRLYYVILRLDRRIQGF